MSPSRLVERERELARLAELATAAAEGRGRVVLVEGPAGIGKTRLLSAARELDALRTLSARGSELERDFPFGAVRQLLEPHLATLGAEERAPLFEGGAAHALPLLTTASAPAGDDYATLYGLYWLLVALSQREPLLLAVDDIHWLDLPSLRFLGFLARRLDGMRVLLCGALRPAEPGTDRELLTDLALDAETIRPAPLSRRGAMALIADVLGTQPEPEHVARCYEATGGNPFYLRAAARAGVDEHGGLDVSRLLRRRLTALGPGAPELAHALAILGDGATLPQAAQLAGLDNGAAAADALERAGITNGLAFVHPIVRASIYNDIPPAERVERHRAAARIVAGDAVAAQLLHAGAPDAWAVAQLRETAARALRRGAPEHAAACLRHALDGGAERAAILFELGLAEAVAQDPGAIEHLYEARALATDPVQRAQIGAILCELLVYTGDWDGAIELSTTARAELAGRHPELDLQLRTLSTASAAYDPRLVAELVLELDDLAEAALSGGPAGRPLALLLAAVHANRGERLEAVRPLLAYGLDGGALLAEAHAEAWCFPQAMMGLVGIDELDAAELLASEMLSDARARGSIRGFAVANGMHLYAHGAGGHLNEVEHYLRTALELVEEHGIVFAVPSGIRWGLDLMLERPEAADLVTFARGYELPPALANTVSGAWMLEVRARLQLQAGELAAGVEGLRRAGRIFSALGCENVGFFDWRGALALAVDPEEGLDLAREQLAAAERCGLPRGIGIATRTLGLLEGSIDRLRTAVELLAPTPARLEHARALVELGAALRRANQRAQARAPLAEGMDLAAACGATRLADRARFELRATGARPRRKALTGRAALTASELRIAELAAAGHSNPAIAQALFVTVKTVEGHLSGVYRKLDVRSRADLPAALSQG